MNVLFVCNQNENRSKTAEEIFKNRVDARSAGLFCDNPITERQISWADLVVVMEDAQRSEIARRFPKAYMAKRIVSLGIPDVYHHNQPELIDVLNSRMKGLL
jgi:predicted protein tyrosine phosphatase